MTHISPASNATPSCPNQSGTRRARRAIAACVVGATLCVGVLAGGATTASAAQGGLETNAMAPVVTSSARSALASYDEFTQTDSATAYRSFVRYRAATARFAATELGYPNEEMASAWAVAPIDHQLAVLAAMTQVGVPYRKNTSEEGVGFDCSGLTTYAWSKAGVQLVRQSGQQINNALPLDRSTARAGDLVQYPGHVMMYLGVGDAVIHSVQSGRTVELDTISSRRVNSVRFGDPTA